ncbi:calcium and integrin-binding protein 1-like [Styela clava]
MGGSQSVFSDDELQEYSDLTFFSKKEILHVFKRFAEVDPDAVNQDRFARIPLEKVCQIPELKVNPFNDRICKVFSTALNGDGSLMFEDFLDMMSAFSDLAPRNVKAEWAFKIYDFNGDDLLDSDDLQNVVNRLTGSDDNLTEEEMDQLINNVMIEADLDDDNQLSFAEFEHVISKCPDFMNSFRIRL